VIWVSTEGKKKMKKCYKLLLFSVIKKKGYGVSGSEEEDEEERLWSFR
jgi:hypothetical protein